MIEISHQLAQRLLRKKADGPLPEEQWAVLQTHLESCADCRAYRDRLEGIERGVRRALRAGWEAQPGPADDLPERVAASQVVRAARRRNLRRALAPLVFLVFFWLLGGPGWLAGLLRPVEVVPSAGLAEVPLPTPAATARPGEFPGVVVFAARAAPGADSEIYLLNPGAPLLNLSRHPAEDSDPAWSPDGEWLAFLSERAGSRGFPGSNEVFVTDLTGGRLVQLTHDPAITWQGPLSWSRDGRWIALTGIREAQGRQSWVYLVPLDGSGPVALAGTRGGWSPRFSRFGSRLAFAYADGARSGIAVYHRNAETLSAADWPENSLTPGPLPAASFDWSFDSTALVYIAGPSDDAQGSAPGSQVVATRGLNFPNTIFYDLRTTFRVAESTWPSAFRAVTWTPVGAVVYLESLRDARARPEGEPAEECWRIHTRTPGLYQNEGPVEQFGGLCVESGFDSGSWTPDGRWLVTLGRAPGESQSELYAVRVASSAANAQRDDTQAEIAQPGALLRLTDTAYDFLLPGALPRVRPSLRVHDSPLRIDPQPAARLRYQPPPSNLSAHSAGPPGQIAYVVQSGRTSLVISANPDGTGGQVLFSGQGEIRCPVWSPQGQQIALLARAPALEGASGGGSDLSPDPFALPADPSRPPQWLDGDPPIPSVEHIYRVDPGGALRQVSRSGPDGVPAPGLLPTSLRYGCPVWSPEGAPGGPYLAALLSAGERHWLAVLPLRAGAAPRYLPLGTPAAAAGPLWSPDGRSLFLAETAPAGGQQLVSVGLPDSPEGPLTRAELPWADAAGLAALPRSPYLVVASLENARQERGQAILQQVDLEIGAVREIGRVEAPQAWRASHLTRLPNGTFGLALHASPSARHKTSLVQFDPLRARTSLLAEIEDRLIDLAWSPDGRWLIYTSESGLWGLDIQAALAQRAGPVWLSPVPVAGLDWK